MTILEFLNVTGGYFSKHGVESPRLTAELLLATALGKKRMQLYLEFESEVSPAVLDQLRPLVKRRAQGEPLQYVQGFAEFAGAKFIVTPDVLIPRPETELLLERMIALLGPTPDPAHGALADLGTGSGILAVTLARKFPALPVHAVDLSPAALAVARSNGEGLANLTFHEGNLLAPLAGIPLQAVAANLPYIPSPAIETLSREVRQEPRLALDGGADGLDLVRELIAQNASSPAPLLGLEIGDGQAAAVGELLKAGGYRAVESIKDLRGMARVLIGNNRG